MPHASPRPQTVQQRLEAALHYTHLESQLHRHRRHPDAAEGVPPILREQLGMPGP